MNPLKTSGNISVTIFFRAVYITSSQLHVSDVRNVNISPPIAPEYFPKHGKSVSRKPPNETSIRDEGI